MVDRLTGFLVTVVLALGSYCWYQYSSAAELRERNASLIGTVDKSERLEGEVLKLRTEYKRAETIRAELEQKFTELKIKQTETAKLLANTGVKLGGQVGEGNRIRIDGYNSPEICYTEPENNLLGVYKFKIDTDLGLLVDNKTGKYRAVIKTFYILDSSVDSEWAGRPYQLKTTEGLLTADPTNSELLPVKSLVYFPFNINLGLSSSKNPTLTTSLLGYGYSKQNLDFKLLNVGASLFNNKIIPYIDLVSVRPLSKLLVNTYIGLGYSKEDSWTFSISAGL